MKHSVGVLNVAEPRLSKEIHAFDYAYDVFWTLIIRHTREPAISTVR